jgi:hypothetical protein
MKQLLCAVVCLSLAARAWAAESATNPPKPPTSTPTAPPSPPGARSTAPALPPTPPDPRTTVPRVPTRPPVVPSGAPSAPATAQKVLPAPQATPAAVLVPQGPAPKLLFEKMVYDFGKVTQAEKVNGKFTFSNAGEGELKLEKPTSNCGCTVAGVKPDVLKPGEKGEIEFSLNIPPGRAKLEKQIYVTSNDPQSPRVTLTVKAEHEPLYDFTPSMINLTLHEGLSTNVPITVKRTDGQKLNISKIENNATNWLTAQLLPAEPPDETAARIMLTMKAEGTPRRVGDWVRVHTDGAEKATFQVWSNLRIVGDVIWSPDAVVWNINDPEQLKKQLAPPDPAKPLQEKKPQMDWTLVRRLSISSGLAGQTLQVTNLQTDLKGVELHVETNQVGRVYAIVAKLTEIPDKTTNGKLSFETNLGKQTKVEVPMIVSVLKR